MNSRHASMLGIAASLSSALGLVIVFRFSIALLGPSMAGSWALIQSVFFLARIAEGGVGINLTRAYAVDRRQYGELSAHPYYISGLALALPPAFIIGAALIIPAKALLIGFLGIQLEPTLLLQILFVSYVNSLMSAIAAVGMALAEGRGLLSWRHAGTIASNTVFVAGAFPLMSRFGVIGLPLLYLLASLVGVVISLILVNRCRKGARAHSVGQLVSGIASDSLRAVGMAVLRTGFEPWTKFLVGAFGSLATVAAVDLAFKVTTQVRVVIQSATQPLLYVGARSGEKMSPSVFRYYSVACAIVADANLAALVFLAAFAPLVSWLGFGYASRQVEPFLLVLAIGNAINSMGVIGYYSEVSGGGLSKVLRIHLVMMVLNVLLGLLAGWTFGALGAVSAYAVSFIYGGLSLLKIWARASSSRLIDLIWPGRVNFAVALCSLCCSVGLAFSPGPPFGSLLSASMGLMSGALLLVVGFQRFRSLRSSQ